MMHTFSYSKQFVKQVSFLKHDKTKKTALVGASIITLVASGGSSNSAHTGNVTTPNTATEDAALIADTSSIADLDGLGTFNYQWKIGSADIAGATLNAYTPTQSDVNSGQGISVKVTYEDGAGNTESSISTPTAAVTNINDLPTGAVTFSGVLNAGQTLTANNTLADEDGLGTLSYEWTSSGTVVGNGATYVYQASDVGNQVKVKISYTDGQGTAESVISGATPAPNNAPTGGVTISGTPEANGVLTLSNNIADADGLGTMNYQWYADGVAINSATNTTYTLTNAEIGKQITVKASYTDGQGNAEIVASTPTTAVAQPAVLKIADFDTSNGMRIKGSDDYESTGSNISKAGDFNADGYDDFILNSFTGKGYLIYGSQNGLTGDIQLGNLTAAQGTTFNKSGLNEYSGYFISDIGDVNGDGYDDIIIDSRTNPSGPFTAHVVFGNSTGLGASFDLSSLNGTNGFSFANITNGVTSVSAIGDFNGDGFDDFSITNMFGDQTSALNGYSATYVVFGANTFNNGFDLTTLNGSNGFIAKTTLSVQQKQAESAGAGDINGDGFDDLIIGNVSGSSLIGSPEGNAYIVFGTSTPITTELDLGSLNGSNGFNIAGNSTVVINGSPSLYNWFGRSVSGIADINGDGIDDFAVVAGNNGGDAYVFFGSTTAYTSASFDVTTLNGANGFKLTGSRKNDIADAGDINGDGYADLIIGGQLVSNAGLANSGSAYVLFGHANGFSATIDLNALDGSDGFRVDGDIYGGFFGGSVDGAGDVNGDGFDDIIIGAYAHEQNLSPNPIGKGENFLIYGGTHFSASVNAGMNGNNVVTNVTNPNHLVGGRGDDNISGTNGNDVLIGGHGSDNIDGQQGADILFGGGGRDKFDFGVGSTTLTIGGTGNNGTISGYDIIKDYQAGNGTINSELIVSGQNGHVVADTAGTDGVNSTLTDSNVTIKSHKIVNGVITFDELENYMSNSMKISTESQIAMATEYLQLQNNFGQGGTVAFDVGSDSFLFTQGDALGTDSLDILIRLEDMQVENIIEGTSGATGMFDLLIL